MDVGMGSRRKRSSRWMRDGDLVKWVTATARAHKAVMSTYANMPSHTVEMTETVSSCVPTACSPC